MELRVLHAPAAVGGHPTGLAAAERELGVESHVLTVHAAPFGYPVDEVLAPQGTSPLLREWRRWRAVARARSFDIVHFNFGSSLAPAYHGGASRGGPLYRAYARAVEQLDLRLIRRPYVVTFQGDDARPSGDAADDARKRRRVQRFAGAAQMYVLNPDLLDHVAGAMFLPYASVDPRAWRPVSQQPATALRTVHAPSDRARKGTDEILAAVDRVRADGIEVELELVEGRTRDEARRALERADVLIDQLVVGWYGGVAVEAMALGKPAVARIDASALERVPRELRDELPIVHADAATLADVLRRLARQRGELAEIGRRSRAFVEHHHDPLSIARRVVADYERALGTIARS